MCLSARLRISSSPPVDGKFSFVIDVIDFDESLFEFSFELKLGELTLCNILVGEDNFTSWKKFVTHYFYITQLAVLESYDFILIVNEAKVLTAHFEVGDGVILEALTITDSEVFRQKVQEAFTRFSSNELRMLAAKATVVRMQSSFLCQAAGLTILAHRVLDKDFTRLTSTDITLAKWVCSRYKKVVDEALKRILDKENVSWEDVRWTSSLCSVAGYLHLIMDEVRDAQKCFKVVMDLIRYVALSPVSALNMINACFVHGLICHTLLERQSARHSFETGVQSYKAVVIAQDLMLNVWVLGDLLESIPTSLQCYIALIRFGYLAQDSGPLIDSDMEVGLKYIKSPLRRILIAGLSPTLMAGIEGVSLNRQDA